MKFNRRFVGIATACALATSALVAPNAVADETPATDTNQSSISTGSELSSKLGSSLDAGAQLSSGDTGKSAGDTDTTEENSSSSKVADLFRDEDGKVDPSKITAWIGVITAVVGALATLASHLDIPGMMNR